MNFSRELWMWTWPDWGKVFFVELLISLAIIGVAVGTALASYVDAVFKAKFVEPTLFASGARMEVVERLALSGDPVETPLERATTVIPGAEAYLSGQRTVAEAQDGKAKDAKDVREVVKEAAKQYEERLKSGGGGVSKYVSSTLIVGNSIVVRGVIDGRQYEFSLYPAVADEETPSVYLWLCGRSRTPEGWLAQPPVPTRYLPDHLQISDCRRRRNE